SGCRAEAHGRDVQVGLAEVVEEHAAGSRGEAVLGEGGAVSSERRRTRVAHDAPKVGGREVEDSVEHDSQLGNRVGVRAREDLSLAGCVPVPDAARGRCRAAPCELVVEQLWQLPEVDAVVAADEVGDAVRRLQGRLGRVQEHESIATRAAGQLVGAAAADQNVVALAAAKRVASFAAIEVVVAAFAVELVVAGAAEERIGAAPDSVQAAIAVDGVVAIAAADRVIAEVRRDGIAGKEIVETLVTVAVNSIARRAAVRVDPVGTRTAVHDVGAGAGVNLVVVGAAEKPVVAGPAIDVIGAAAAVDVVVIGFTEEGVTVGAAADRVIAAAAVDLVVAGFAVNDVAAGTGVDEILAFAGVDHIAAIARVDEVAAIAGVDQVITATRGNRVVAAVRLDEVVTIRCRDGVVAVTGDVRGHARSPRMSLLLYARTLPIVLSKRA